MKSPPTILAALFLAASLAPCYPDDPDLIITEFLAANSSGLLDEDGDSSDWIEIHNTTQEPMSLEDWYLTDDQDNLTKWRFPNITIETRGFVLVFASGKNRFNPKTELHANFKLNRDGDYLALVQPDKNTIATEFSLQFPVQINDVSYGQRMDLEIHPYLTGESKGKMHFRSSAQAAAHWIRPDFDDENWKSATTAVGYISKDHFDPVASPMFSTDDITKPEDDIIPTSFRSPVGETVENAIDNNSKTKYLNFDRVNTGLTITTAGGVVTGLALTSANDAPDRDPANFMLSGSNDDGVTFTKIASGNVPKFLERFDRQTVSFHNDVAYTKYKLIFPTTVGPSSCCMQIAEAEFLGISGPSSSGLEDLILTNIETGMFGRTAVLDLRFPFNVKAGDPTDYLNLNVRYSGGFLAYLNGVLVAQSNAPENPDFSSTSVLKRQRKDTLTWESFGINAEQIRKDRNLLAIRALNDSANSLEFLFQARLENARESLGATGYFSSPTPGYENGEPRAGLAAAPETNHEHGFYETPFELVLSSITEGASIRYTTDGSKPTLTTGETYTAPIPIDHTTVLRTTAFHKNWLPSKTLTQTYIFAEDTIRQTSLSAKNSGFPERWDYLTADYDLDQRVTGLNGKDRYGGKYKHRLKHSLQSLASISIVMDIGDLFGSRGIYSNPERRGGTWERPASVEMIHPNKSQGFQENIGIRIQGGGLPNDAVKAFDHEEIFPTYFQE